MTTQSVETDCSEAKNPIVVKKEKFKEAKRRLTEMIEGIALDEEFLQLG